MNSPGPAEEHDGLTTIQRTVPSYQEVCFLFIDYIRTMEAVLLFALSIVDVSWAPYKGQP